MNDPNIEVPEGGDAGTMTCQWLLDGGNCWKEHTESIRTSCGIVTGATGSFEDAWTCRLTSGQLVEFSSPLGEPPAPDAGDGYRITAYQIREPVSGQVCFRFDYNFGRTRFRVGTTDVYLQSTGSYTYDVVCPDLSRINNTGPEACSQGFFLWGQGRLPGHSVVCSVNECVLEYTGTVSGRSILARCQR